MFLFKTMTSIFTIILILISGLVIQPISSQPPEKISSFELLKPPTAQPPDIKIDNSNNADIMKTSNPTIVEPNFAVEEKLTPQLISTRVVVKLSAGINPEPIADSVGAEIIRRGPLQFITLAIPSETDKKVKILINTPGVLSVQPIRKVQATEMQKLSSNVNDPQYSLQWGLTKASVQKAWDLGATGQGITLAVIDTGVDLKHPDLKDNILSGYNSITGTEGRNATQDNNGHGTHVSGIIAAELNGVGIVGVAYQSKILPIKALNRDGEGTDDCIADGIVWAADHGAKIINLSLGSDTEEDVLKEAIKYASDKGCLIIAAAGNQEENTSLSSISYPAADPHVMAITASDSNDKVASFSLTGPQAALTAPGVNIVSDFWDGSSDIASLDGSSMASPFVAGVAALVWGAHPDLKAQQVRMLLENSALDLGAIGRDNSYGYGRVNAYWALRFADKPNSYPSPAKLDWAGGIVQGGTTTTSVSLNIPERTFGLDPTTESAVTINRVTAPVDFPAGIQPFGGAISIDWTGNVKKVITLSITIPNNPASSGLLGYIYHWSGSRWLLIGGGINNSTIKTGITEPGIYRVGYKVPPENQRIAGSDRIETSILISQNEFPQGSDTVILARADDFPDALAGVPLAYKVHAPILLTSSDKLSDAVNIEIKRLNPKLVMLLGGTGAISLTIEQQLKNSFLVQRLGGSNRYETAALIAGSIGTLGQAVIVNGNNFPDAISIGSIAAQSGIPILLSNLTLPKDTDTVLRHFLVSETIVVGGEGVISSDTFKLLPNPTRLAGNDRYATAAAVLNAYSPQGSLVFLATGENFPDALTGGVFAAINKTNLVVLPPSGLSSAEQSVIQTWHGQKTYVFGGITVVPDEIVNKVQLLIK